MKQLPDAFNLKIRALLGAESGSFFSALQQAPVTSVRKNPFKPSAIFDDEDVVEWCPDGRYLKERPSFIADPLFHAGAYYVQESSSMFLHVVFNQLSGSINKPLKVLDLCAAPGGKSTLMNSLLKQNDLLVSNEIIRSRVTVLEENLMRWGQDNVIISNNDPAAFSSLRDYFDIILVDAPCSGEGMFRKDEKAIDEWSENNIDLCVGRQQRLISDVLPALKPGGFLVYSTCTFNEKENEENVKWMMDEFELKLLPIQIDPMWPIEKSFVTSSGVEKQSTVAYRFYPHKVKGEGLFMTVLQKPEEINTNNKFREQKLTFVQRKDLDELKKWLDKPDDFDFIIWNNTIHAIRKNLVSEVSILAKNLHLKNAGIKMGEIINGKLIPDHHLALSNALSSEVKSIDVNREQAIKYLRKDNLIFEQKHEQGIYLLRYQGLGLGWVKVLQNRVNNYLPTHLRILKEL